MKRAALAFSVFRSDHAEQISQKLTARERWRLRDGLMRVRDASDGERRAALHDLVRTLRNEVLWPLPATHNEADCPFRCVDAHPVETVAQVLEQAALRQPMLVAVALCHLDEPTRGELWTRLGAEPRAAVLTVLEEVPSITTVHSRGFARDLQARLARERKSIASRAS